MTNDQTLPVPLQLTASARERIAGVLAEERAPYLRVFVQGGGCAGFSYGVMLEHEVHEDDQVLPEQGFALVVDSFTVPLLQGATLDWEEGLRGSQFAFHNPHAVTTCGCGSSFAI